MTLRNSGVDARFYYTEGGARKLIIGITALSTFLLSALAVALGFALWEGKLGEGWMASTSVVCWLILIIEFSAVSGACCYATLRGPRQHARTQIQSGRRSSSPSRAIAAGFPTGTKDNVVLHASTLSSSW